VVLRGYQRHLAENAVGAKLGDGSVADLNADLTALDHEKLARIVAFTKDDTSCLQWQRRDMIACQ
jgi:hypothetical protein